MPRRQVTVRAVRWIALTDSASARRAAAGAVVATLLGRPQMGVDAPAALRSGSNVFEPGTVSPAQNAEPIHYADLGEAFSSLHPPPKPVHPTPRQAFKSYLARSNNRQKPAAPAITPARSRPMPKTRKPGTGGRQPRQGVHTPTTATQRMFDELGSPIDVIPSGNGAVTQVWRTPAADGPGKKLIAVARLSSREVQGGETVGGQLQDCYRLASENDLAVAYVIVSTDFHSELTYEERTDFQVIEDLFATGECKAVAFREPDRVAREILPAELFYWTIKHFGAQLWLADLGRPVDWANDSDVFAIGAKNLVGQMERNRIKARTQTALRRRWVEEGRGWPGSIRFGFRRNERTKFPEVDPEQWPAAVFLHENYAGATTGGDGRHVGVAALGRMLFDEFGFEISDDRIRTMLQDPIYVDGTYTVNCHGHPIACEPIPLGDQAVPLETFQRNQELMAIRRGANSTTPIGTHAFNNLKIIHARCRDAKHPKTGRGCSLKQKKQKDCPARLYHDPFTPASCRGYSLDPELLGNVIRELHRLADNPELQRAWELAARPESVIKAKAYTDAQITDMRGQLANLENERDRLAAEWARDIAGGDRTADLGAYKDLHGALDSEAKRLRSELDVAQAREASATRERRKPLYGSSDQELREALTEVLTVEVPEDQAMRVRRQAVIEACLSAIEIHDVPGEEESADGDGGQSPAVELVLIGHLLPPGEVRAGKRRNGRPLPVSPLDSARDILEAHIRERDESAGAGAARADDRVAGEAVTGDADDDSRTSVQENPYTEVGELLRTGAIQPRRRPRSKTGDIPCWRSPPLPCRVIPLEHREFSDEQCLTAFRRAGRGTSLESPLRLSRYDEMAARRPDLYPPSSRLRRAAKVEGLSLSRWRDVHLYDVPRSELGLLLTRWAPFSDEECVHALHAVSAELGRGRLITHGLYRGWARLHPDRPPITRLETAAGNRGLSFSDWRGRELGNPWDLERVQAAIELADANVDALAVRPGPAGDWARDRARTRGYGHAYGYRDRQGDWEPALGDAAPHHPSLAFVHRCARERGLRPKELFAFTRRGQAIAAAGDSPPAIVVSRACAREPVNTAASEGPDAEAESEAA